MTEYVVILTCKRHNPNKNSVMSLVSNSRENAIALALDENPACYECRGSWIVGFAGTRKDLERMEKK